jgi:hypothetical protein
MPRRTCGCPEDYHLADCPILRPYVPDEDDYEFLERELDYRDDR